MKKRLVVVAVLWCCTFNGLQAQQELQTERLKLFLDCKTQCDVRFLRSEINVVDFVRDNTVSDVHLLITRVQTGGRGRQYQLIFFGQHRFKNLTDTLYFDTEANATDFEERAALANHIKIGLIPYLSQTTAINNMVITYKKDENGQGDVAENPTTDPWNYWVFLISADGSYSADQIYKTFNYSASVNASRVTEKLKASFNARISNNKKSYTLDGSPDGEKVVVTNKDYKFYHQLIKSMGAHWSYGYETSLSQNSFSNYRLRLRFNPAIEYDVFPYKEVNTKFLTLRYGFDAVRVNYFDTTLYNKIREVLLGQGLNVYLSFKQKWGNTSIGLHAHNYLHNMRLYNVGMNANVEVRITGNLSFYINTSGAIVRDQLSLVKGTASEQDILIQRRQLASSYNFWTRFGINYRFGSKLNNFVNPRFEQP